LDRFISFDAANGRLVCEAGVLLGDIQRLVIPRGWILPVTPGTQFATVGGAIANDVHGKNHHVQGTFGEHVLQMALARTNGETIVCGPLDKPNWFAATVGGLGLTGVIVTVEMQLRPVASPWLNAQTVPYNNLEEFFQLSQDAQSVWEYHVSWLDCMSGADARGLFMRANHTGPQTAYVLGPRRMTVPIIPPVSVVNNLTTRLFNSAYFNLKKLRPDLSIVHYQSFFYPLDNLRKWNRIYGPKGFYQYQCVIPIAVGMEAIRSMLHEINRCGQGSFLAVLKTFGARSSVGMLSFAQPGVTLALDFPNLGENTLGLFEKLDAIVGEAHGRLYLAKDARMPRAMFEAGYPHVGKFVQYRDPGISSAMSRRLMGS
jgi:FAD/FMN-containing dehydrogenase